MKNKLITTLYKRNTNGSIQQWNIIVEENSFYTSAGQLNGKLASSKKTIVEGKNGEKKNATTANEQALKEAESKISKKMEEGYFESVEDIDNKREMFEPMLAEKYLDYKNDIVFPVLVSTKIDGHRMIAKKDGLWTRNGKQYFSCPHIFKFG